MPAPKELDPTASIAAFLGHKVRRERERQGWRQEDLAGKVFVSRIRVAKIELGTDPPHPRLAAQFDQVLGLDEELFNLAKVVSNSAVRDYAQVYLQRQAEATAMHEFGIVVPGLLQTEGYARAAMLAGQAGDSKDIDGYVDRRMGGQRIWERDEPPWLWLILDEAVLRRVTGSAATMRGQLTHLLEMADLPHINIQMLPWTAMAVPGSLALLTFPNGDRGAYTEGFSTGAYTEEPSEVSRFQRVYDRMHADALNAGASVDLIAKAREEHR